MLQAGNSTSSMEDVQQFLLYIIQGILQNSTGIYALALMNQESGNTQSTDWLISFLVIILKIIINKPVYGWINRHINLSIVQSCNTSQHNRRTICLYCGTSIEIIHILQENSYRNLLISIVTCMVNTNQRNKFNLWMSLQHGYNILLLRIRGDDIQ